MPQRRRMTIGRQSGGGALAPSPVMSPWTRRSLSNYARQVARRPSDEWQRRVGEQAAELARGSVFPADAYAARLWPESLRVGTDAALGRFEHELRALDSPSDADILDLVQRLALALNAVNEQQERAGLIGIETDER